MVVHRFVWGLLAAIVVGPAAVGAVAAGAAIELVVLGTGLAVFAGLFVGVVLDDHPARWSWVRRTVLWAGLGAPGVDALVTTWGAAGSVVALLLVLSAPPVVASTRAAYVVWAARRTTGPAESLSERDLRRRWDSTTSEVRRGSTPVARRLALVDERRRLLDELQRRDPASFDSWLATAVPPERPSRQPHRER